MKTKEVPQRAPAVTRVQQSATTHYWRWMALVTIMVLGFIVASVVYQKGGWLFGEADWFLIDHLSDRSFFSKVICPHSHDAGQYQAREFSHVLEYIDAHFIYWCVTKKIPHFYSVMNFVILFIISLAFWHNVTKYLKMDRLTALLLIGMFWTTPCIFLSGVHVRTAKQGASFFLFFLIWFLVKRIAFPRQSPDDKERAGALRWRSELLLWCQTFLLGLALCWMDRQGFFLVAIILLTLMLFAVGPGLPHARVFLTALTAALVLHSIYNYKIGPPLIRYLTGFQVSFEYQKLPLDKLFEHLFSFLWRGSLLLLNNFRYFFANLTSALSIFVLAGMVWLYGHVRARFVPSTSNRPFEMKTFFGFLLVLWLAVLVGLNALMVLRHEALEWPDVRAYYYWIPTTVLVLVGVAFAVHLFAKQGLVPLWMARSILAAAMLSNLTSLPEHNLITRTGHMRGYMAGTPFLLKAIKALYENPPGPAPVGKYDTVASSRYEDFGHVTKNPLANPQLSAEDYVNSSNFYQWLRSKRNLDFKQW